MAGFHRLWNDIHGVGQPSQLPELPVQRGQCVGRLTSPEPGATVDAEIRVEGFVHAVPPGHHIWIAHQDRRGLFWAKEFEVTLDDDGHFERYVAEGGSSPGLMVLLLLASESGHAQLVDWIAESSRSGRYPGIPPSPTRFYVLDQVEIRLDRSTA